LGWGRIHVRFLTKCKKLWPQSAVAGGIVGVGERSGRGGPGGKKKKTWGS